jgi:predicted DNA-binding protein (MmcQ/YjbR family)
MPRTQSDVKRVEQTLREFALGLPETYEEFPWGERVVKVKGKVFVFLGVAGEGLGMSTKLPESHGAALMFPFATPTGYGLGKSGWVSAQFGPKDNPPVEILRAWIEESYRAVAPKKLVAQLSAPAAAQAGDAPPAKKPKPAARPARARATTSKRAKKG